MKGIEMALSQGKRTPEPVSRQTGNPVWERTHGRKSTSGGMFVFCCLTLFFLMGADLSFAAETDQYYSWGRPLADSTQILNARVNLEIAEAIGAFNREMKKKNEPARCEMVAQTIMNRFTFIGVHKIEYWAQTSDAIDRIPADSSELDRYRQENLYRYNHPPWWQISFISLGHTVRVDGVRLGTDKLGHFFMQGWRYYQAWLAARRAGASDAEAVQKAIDVGIEQELGTLGLASSGVFSFADLEANFQGFRFFRSLCHGESPRLRHDGQGWVFEGAFDWRDYVDPLWDESYNNSAFTPERWEGVERALLETCHKLLLDDVQALRRSYRKIHVENASTIRLREEIEAGRIPDPKAQSIDAVCARGDGIVKRRGQRGREGLPPLPAPASAQ